MNTLRNKVQLLGHVGQDPEISVLEDGKKMAKFSMATNEVFTTAAGEKVEKTYWHRITFWNRPAQIVEEHVRKKPERTFSPPIAESMLKKLLQVTSTETVAIFHILLQPLELLKKIILVHRLVLRCLHP